MAPFEINKEGGVPIWRPPTAEEISEFNDDLLHPQEQVQPIPTIIQQRISQLVTDTLQGNKLLVNANKSIVSGFSTLVKKGVKPVDIILPVYGGLHVLKPCIESILERTVWPFKLTIIDDCSPDFKTREWLEGFAETHKEYKVLFNAKNRGFAASVNRGILHSSNPYICVVNSDIIVTNNWLCKMLIALKSNPKNKIVNPVTNNTAVINVPFQAGYSYTDMNRALEITSSRRYPEIMPTGFCFLMERSLTNSIGLFDEAYKSYGEESDYWMRTITHVEEGEYKRWRAILADDTYIYHERGSSFNILGADEHMSQRKGGSERFHRLWPHFKQWYSTYDVKKSLGSLRKEIPKEHIGNTEAKYDIAFVVFSAAYCGGMHFIADIVNELNEQGVNAKVVQIKRKEDSDTSVLTALRSAPIVFETIEDFIKSFSGTVFDRGVVVAATNELAQIVGMLCKKEKNLTSVLFAQSDDEEIAPDEITKKAMKKASSLVDYIICNSSWLNKKINDDGFKTLGYVRPGVDTDLFYPRDRNKGDDRPTVLLSLLKTYPFKGFDRGVEVAKTLWQLAGRAGLEIRILAIGIENLPEHTYTVCLGPVTQPRLAHLFGTEVDVFCDPSHIQTYGLPSLEAIASGVVPVCWDNKGINEYVNDNGIVMDDTTPPTILAKKIFDLLKNRNELSKYRASTITQVRKSAVNEFITLLESKLALRPKQRDIAVITPHLRKYGGPTTILQTANNLARNGHKVNLYTIYPDINPEIEKMSKVPIRVDWKNIGKADVLITNSDNPHNRLFASHGKIKKKILLKLSHNERFKALEEDSLNIKWDNIITSTDWLAKACVSPTSGWKYKSQPATRVGWYHYSHELFSVPLEEKPQHAQPIIGTLIHHHPLKGTGDALKAFEAIKAKYQNQVNLIGVGEVQDFQRRTPEWMRYFYNPNRDNMANIMKNVDIWVVASHTEGLGRMSLEAMSSRCSLVISNTNPEFAKNGKNCILFKPGDVQELVDTLIKVIEDPDLRIMLSNNGYQTAERYADPEPYMANIEKVIQDLFND